MLPLGLMLGLSPISYEHPRRSRPFVSSAEKLKNSHSDHYFAFDSRISYLEDAIARMEFGLNQKLDTFTSRIDKLSDLCVTSSRAVAAVSNQFEDFKSDICLKLNTSSAVNKEYIDKQLEENRSVSNRSMGQLVSETLDARDKRVFEGFKSEMTSKLNASSAVDKEYIAKQLEELRSASERGMRQFVSEKVDALERRVCEEFKSEMSLKLNASSTVDKEYIAKQLEEHRSVSEQGMRNFVAERLEALDKRVSNQLTVNFEKLSARQTKLESGEKTLVDMLETELRNVNKDLAGLSSRVTSQSELMTNISEEMRLTAEGTCGDLVQSFSHKYSRQVEVLEEKLAVSQEQVGQRLVRCEEALAKADKIFTYINQQVSVLRSQSVSTEAKLKDLPSPPTTSELQQLVDQCVGQLRLKVNQENHLLRQEMANILNEQENLQRDFRNRQDSFQADIYCKQSKLHSDLRTEIHDQEEKWKTELRNQQETCWNEHFTLQEKLNSLAKLVEHHHHPPAEPPSLDLVPVSLTNHLSSLTSLLSEMNSSTIPNIYREVEVRLTTYELKSDQKVIELMKELCADLESDIARIVELIHSVYVQAGFPMPAGTLSSWKRFREVLFDKESLGDGMSGRRPVLGDAILSHLSNRGKPGKSYSITRYRP